jgi:DNA-binding transcriptional MocR family regulator
LVDVLAADVERGLLVAGDRLPPQRELAARLGVTVVTVGKAYRAAARRGLVRGEVGRGTVVLPVGASTLGGGETALVDLAANFVVPETETLLAALSPLVARLLATRLRAIPPPAGFEEDRVAGAAWLARDGWSPKASATIVTAGGQHAMVVALAALSRAGAPLLVEELTYPGIKAAAGHLGLPLVPVAIDGEGVVPSALEAAVTSSGARLLYCQPTLHNPTAAVMSTARRQAIAELARRLDLQILEDDVYGFLAGPTRPLPIAAWAPERTLYFRSATKAVVSGLRVGFLVAPEVLLPRLVAEIAATVWYASPALTGLLGRWLGDGTVRALEERKREVVADRQALAAPLLAAVGSAAPGSRWPNHPAASHLLLEIPEPWRVNDFVAAARAAGVVVQPAEVFTIGRQPAPEAIRVCLGAAARPRLEQALAVLGDLLHSPPPLGAVI